MPPRQENCKNNKILHRSKNYQGFHDTGQPASCHNIAKKEGANTPPFTDNHYLFVNELKTTCPGQVRWNPLAVHLFPVLLPAGNY
jgi:hypothetical protein